MLPLLWLLSGGFKESKAARSQALQEVTVLSEPWRDLTPVPGSLLHLSRPYLQCPGSGLSISSSPKCVPRGHSLLLLHSSSLASLVPPSLCRQTDRQQTPLGSCPRGSPYSSRGHSWSFTAVKQHKTRMEGRSVCEAHDL